MLYFFHSFPPHHHRVEEKQKNSHIKNDEWICTWNDAVQLLNIFSLYSLSMIVKWILIGQLHNS
jgi:hypothetical protein